MSKRYAPPIKNFADFWGRAGLPAGMKLEAQIAWDAALEAAAELLEADTRGLREDTDPKASAAQTVRRLKTAGP